MVVIRRYGRRLHEWDTWKNLTLFLYKRKVTYMVVIRRYGRSLHEWDT